MFKYEKHKLICAIIKVNKAKITLFELKLESYLFIINKEATNNHIGYTQFTHILGNECQNNMATRLIFNKL